MFGLLGFALIGAALALFWWGYRINRTTAMPKWADSDYLFELLAMVVVVLLSLGGIVLSYFGGSLLQAFSNSADLAVLGLAGLLVVGLVGLWLRRHRDDHRIAHPMAS